MTWWWQLRGAGPLYPIFLILFGAIAGSFASAAIFRVPREGLSIFRPVRSMCTSCGVQLAWYDNLPLIGWLLVRGRCRSCSARISWTYLLHELVLAVVFLAAGYSWMGDEGPMALVIGLVALTGLYIAAAIDWNHYILPDGLTLGGIPFGIVASLLVPTFQIWDRGTDVLPWGVGWMEANPIHSPVVVAGASALVGALVSAAFLFGLRSLFSYLLRQEALGLGDVKYLAAVGALLGLEGSAWTLLVGVLVGAVLGLLNIARMTFVVSGRRRKKGLRKGWRDTLRTGWMLGRLIPFGPALVIGTILVLLAPIATRRFFLDTWPSLLRDLLS